MTQDEIIEMARQAGMAYEDDTDRYIANIDDLQDFAKLVAEKAHEEFGLPAVGILERTVARAVAKEREACAKEVETIETYEKIEKACFKFAAKTIRAKAQADGGEA